MIVAVSFARASSSACGVTAPVSLMTEASEVVQVTSAPRTEVGSSRSSLVAAGIICPIAIAAMFASISLSFISIILPQMLALLSPIAEKVMTGVVSEFSFS